MTQTTALNYRRSLWYLSRILKVKTLICDLRIPPRVLCYLIHPPSLDRQLRYSHIPHAVHLSSCCSRMIVLKIINFVKVFRQVQQNCWWLLYIDPIGSVFFFFWRKQLFQPSIVARHFHLLSSKLDSRVFENFHQNWYCTVVNLKANLCACNQEANHESRSLLPVTLVTFVYDAWETSI